MLCREYFGRRHKGRLLSVFHSRIHGIKRYGGLAAAHISLKQPVHEPFARKIAPYLLHSFELGVGWFEGQKPYKAAHRSFQLQRLLPFRQAILHHRQRKAEHQRILKGQSLPRRLYFLHIAREMKAPKGIIKADKAILLPHGGRQTLLYPFTAALKSCFDRIPQQLLRKAGTHRIYRQYTRQLPVYAGIYHLYAMHPVHPAAGVNALARHYRLHSVRLVIPREGDLAALVKGAGGSDIQPAAHPGKLGIALELQLQSHVVPVLCAHYA